MKTKLTVTTPAGNKLSRTTARSYTHAVVLEGEWGANALAWCGSPRLAEGQLRSWTNDGGRRLRWRYKIGDRPWTVRILPVDGSGAFPVGPIHHSPVVAEVDETVAFIEDDGGLLEGLPEVETRRVLSRADIEARNLAAAMDAPDAEDYHER